MDETEVATFKCLSGELGRQWIRGAAIRMRPGCVDKDRDASSPQERCEPINLKRIGGVEGAVNVECDGSKHAPGFGTF